MGQQMVIHVPILCAVTPQKPPSCFWLSSIILVWVMTE